MRVLYATPGHAAHDERFRAAIEDAGHECHVFVIDPEWPTDHALARFRDILDRLRPDIVHAGPIDTVARLAARAGARPLVAASWAFDLLGETTGTEAGRNRAASDLAAADALIVDCRTVGRAAEALGFPPERTILLPWGVDLDRFRPGHGDAATALRASLDWQDATIVVMARAHEPVYGVDVAVDGFILAAIEQPSLRLLVAGDGSLTGSLHDRLSQAGMGERARFMGRVPNTEVPTLLGVADIYLSASRLDGSSVTLLEAMAMGLPAVVSDIPGNREWVEDGTTGRLFADGDAAAAGAALADVAAAPADVRTAYAMAARRAIGERADWQRNVGRLFVAYDIARTAAARG